MKIRTGFVSNSSSSSFILYGYIFDKNTDVLSDIMNKLGYDVDVTDGESFYEVMDDFFDKGFYISDDPETGAPKNKIIIGKILNEVDSESASFDEDEKRININQLNDIQKELDIFVCGSLDGIDKELVLYFSNRSN